MTEYLTKDGDMLDEIAWNYYGTTIKTLEPLLEANRGLADMGIVFTAGVKIKLPEIQKPGLAETIKLWD